MMNKKNSLLIISLFLVVTIFFLLSLTRLNVNVSSEYLLPARAPSIESMRRMESLFGEQKQIIIVVKTDGLFKSENSLKIYAFMKALSGVPGIVSFNSYLDASRVSVSVFGGVSAEPYFRNGIASESVEEILKNALYVDNLVDREGRVALIPIDIEDRNTVASIMALAQEHLKGLEFFSSGKPVVDNELNRSIFSLVIVYPPILFALICFIYYLRLGSVKAALVPSILSGFAAIWTYGLGSVIGFEINILTSTVGLFIVIISSSYGLHFIDRYITNRRIFERTASLKRTIREERVPIFLSALTTAVGFLTFIISSLDAFKQLGILVSSGIMISSALTLLALPAFISFFDLPAVERKLKFASRSREKSKRLDFVLLIAILIFAALSPLFILGIEQNFDQFDYFRDNSDVVKSARVIREEFGWNMPFYVMLSKESLFTGSDSLAISGLIEEIQKLPKVHGVSSIMDVSKAFNIPLPILQLAARNGNLPLEQYMIGNTIRLLIKTPNTDAVNAQALETGLKEILKDYEQYSPYIASPLLIIAGVNNEVLGSQVSTIIWAMIAITVLLLVVFRSLRLALISVMPIALSVTFNFAYMGIFSVKLEISTAIVAGVLLGLTVDYAIHLVSRYVDVKDIYRARQEVKPAILSNTLALAAGFASLVFAPLKLFSGLGLLLSIGMGTGALLTLILIPRVVRSGKKSI